MCQHHVRDKDLEMGTLTKNSKLLSLYEKCEMTLVIYDCVLWCCFVVVQ